MEPVEKRMGSFGEKKTMTRESDSLKQGWSTLVRGDSRDRDIGYLSSISRIALAMLTTKFGLFYTPFRLALGWILFGGCDKCENHFHV